MSNTRKVKCVVIGDITTGKTSFLSKATTNELPENSFHTIMFGYFSRDLHLVKGKQVALSFVDTCKSHTFLYNDINACLTPPSSSQVMVPVGHLML